ncbi:MAG TPA: hypothetical protein VM733_02110, partial [Thermoanaerobaculia bacterium]|nr:hypothetical protein [Thermoanaerobaculia bacterium]
MQERIDLVVVAEDTQKRGGLSLSVVVSLIAHVALLIWFITSYKPASGPRDVPIARYVELMTQNPQSRDFTEAPGREVPKAPLNAPLSDHNRKASMPEPTGPNPTTRPGDGSNATYRPPAGASGPRASSPAAPSAPAPQTSAQMTAPSQSAPVDSSFIYREPAKAAAAAGVVDWRNAIREAGRAISGGDGGDGSDLAQTGGEQGFAEQGPLSFETQWYDWGDYAQSMVSKIRVNWYANMPQIIRTGMKGVVTIRFTIHRDGRISDIT